MLAPLLMLFALRGQPNRIRTGATLAASTGLAFLAWQTWQMNITDDICMAAVAGRSGGIRRGAADALLAGNDLILVSFDHLQVWPVLAGLLDARNSNASREHDLATSR